MGICVHVCVFGHALRVITYSALIIHNWCLKAMASTCDRSESSFFGQEPFSDLKMILTFVLKAWQPADRGLPAVRKLRSLVRAWILERPCDFPVRKGFPSCVLFVVELMCLGSLVL